MDLRKLQRIVVDALEDVKAVDIQVFNTTHQTKLFDRVVVATGNSNRQTRALATSVRDAVKTSGGEVLSIEGLDTGEWVLVDCGDIVVHVLQPVLRQYYKLEEIWGEKPVRVKLGGGKSGVAFAEDPDDTDDAPPAPKLRKPSERNNKVPDEAPAKPARAPRKAATTSSRSHAPAAKKSPARRTAVPRKKPAGGRP